MHKFVHVVQKITTSHLQIVSPHFITMVKNKTPALFNECPLIFLLKAKIICKIKWQHVVLVCVLTHKKEVLAKTAH